MLTLESILKHVDGFKDSLPPVHAWHPEHDAEMDLEIDSDGCWIHEGGAIERQSLVRLLASVIRREDDGRYALVTPQERVFIRVQDVPFLIVDWEFVDSESGRLLLFESSLGERVIVDKDNPLWLKEEKPVPYVMVRPHLAGRLTRAAYYRLIDVLEERDGQWGVESGGFFNVLHTE